MLAAQAQFGQLVIVIDHDLTVLADLQVHLQTCGPCRQRRLKGRRGVLRCVSAGTTVPDDGRCPCAIILLMHSDPILLQLLLASGLLLIVGSIMRFFGQPHVVAYLICGIALGPHGLDLIGDPELFSQLGDIGVMLLLFFVGMKVHPRKLLAQWNRTIFITVAQILLSVALVGVIGAVLDWPIARVLLLGFVISLSSTAVVLSHLEDRGETDSKLGRDVIGILLAQDLAIVPMLISISLLGGESPESSEFLRQMSGLVAIILFMAWLTGANRIRLPLGARLHQDHEVQVFAALLFFLGFANIAMFFHLSAALGAFMAGMLIGVARETRWVGDRLDSFRTLFVALFFVSVGSLVDLAFVAENRLLVLSLLLGVLVTNGAINALAFRLLGEPWGHSIVGGAMLAQIGEFSFLLVAAGMASGAIGPFTYKLTILLIALSLLLSPAMIALARVLTDRRVGVTP